jgi:hypothetical protein
MRVASTPRLHTFPARERRMASRRSVHLVLLSGTKSANEVAQITNKKNNSLKEGASKRFGAEQNAKSY